MLVLHLADAWPGLVALLGVPAWVFWVGRVGVCATMTVVAISLSMVISAFALRYRIFHLWRGAPFRQALAGIMAGSP
jgi:hypothetical protein